MNKFSGKRKRSEVLAEVGPDDEPTDRSRRNPERCVALKYERQICDFPRRQFWIGPKTGSDHRLKGPRIQPDPVLAVATDRLQKRALRQRFLHILLRREILSHLLPAFWTGYLQPFQPGELPQGFDQKPDNIGIFLLSKGQWP